MPLTKFLQKTTTLEIDRYQSPNGRKKLAEQHVAFSGTPRRHPAEREKIILLADPFSTSPIYYEFNLDDVAFVEELANIADSDGDIVAMMRVWVKKKSVGVRCVPFIVDALPEGER